MLFTKARNRARTGWMMNVATARVLEPPEQRIMMSADLTGVVDASKVGSVLVPGDKGSVNLAVNNAGDAATGNITVKLFASSDLQLDQNDALLGTGTVKLKNLVAGKNAKGSVKYIVPAGQAQGSYYLLMQIDSGNVIPESNENNNVTPTAQTRQVLRRFGTFSGRSKIKLTQDGFTFALSAFRRSSAVAPWGQYRRRRHTRIRCSRQAVSKRFR